MPGGEVAVEAVVVVAEAMAAGIFFSPVYTYIYVAVCVCDATYADVCALFASFVCVLHTTGA
jgi:hypothetical protein